MYRNVLLVYFAEENVGTGSPVGPRDTNNTFRKEDGVYSEFDNAFNNGTTAIGMATKRPEWGK